MAGVISIVYRGYPAWPGDECLVVWKQPQGLMFEIQGSRGATKGLVRVTDASALELAQEIRKALGHLKQQGS